MGRDTMIVGSPEHRAHREKEVDALAERAIERLALTEVFSTDQVHVLANVISDLRYAILKLN